MLIRQHGGQWHSPSTTAYTNEAELQALIAETPTLLPGIDSARAAAAREVAVGAAGSVDVLVVEADGQITIVECKLRANPEIRRQVVGQSLAYAAALWQATYEDLDQAFERRSGVPLAAALGEETDGWDEEQFRQTVTRNLADGALRFVIVVDEITDELKRIVTFLNRHTSPQLELRALELQRAVDAGVEVLMPATYGEESVIEKAARTRVDEASVLAAIRAQHPGEAGERMIALYTFMRDRGARLSWGTRPASPSVTAWLGEAAGDPVSVSFYPSGFAVNFEYLHGKRTPAEIARLGELVRSISGAAPYYERLEESEYRIRPTLRPEDVLTSDESLHAFREAIAEAAKQPAS